jgi:hypothetical protein
VVVVGGGDNGSGRSGDVMLVVAVIAVGGKSQRQQLSDAPAQTTDVTPA